MLPQKKFHSIMTVVDNDADFVPIVTGKYMCL